MSPSLYHEARFRRASFIWGCTQSLVVLAVPDPPHAGLVVARGDAVRVEEAVDEVHVRAERGPVGVLLAVAVGVLEGEGAGDLAELFHGHGHLQPELVQPVHADHLREVLQQVLVGDGVLLARELAEGELPVASVGEHVLAVRGEHVVDRGDEVAGDELGQVALDVGLRDVGHVARGHEDRHLLGVRRVQYRLVHERHLGELRLERGHEGAALDVARGFGDVGDPQRHLRPPTVPVARASVADTTRRMQTKREALLLTWFSFPILRHGRRRISRRGRKQCSMAVYPRQ